MSLSHRTLPALAVLCLALSACRQGADTTGAESPSPADEASPATAVLHEVTPADATPASDVDTKALAGRFEGVLPCASCPGIDTVLELRPDGSFDLAEHYADEAGTRFELDGSWSVEGSLLRLDPNAKDAQDRLFQWQPPQSLALLDSEGQPVASETGQGLVRTADLD